MKSLIVDKKYKCTDSTGHTENLYFKYQGQNGKPYFSELKIDAPCLWDNWLHWEVIAEHKWIPYTEESFKTFRDLWFISKIAPYSKVKINEYRDDGVFIGASKTICPYQRFFDQYTETNKTPCGTLEEEVK